ncbi:AMP-binding protein, partial [Pseudomonas aeruginosa]|nr:AMP-binding protein [Pseudomonas aeruginosa]
MNPSPSIVGLSDIEALERVPLEQRDLPSSTYELLQRSAQRHGQRIALSCLLHGSAVEEPLRISYAELFARVTQTANALHRLGLESHQAVSFLLPNLPQTHYVIWGGEAAGIVNAINPLLEPEHIAELIRASNTRVLVTLAPFPGTDLWQKVAGLRAQLPELYAIVVVDPANLLP